MAITALVASTVVPARAAEGLEIRQRNGAFELTVPPSRLSLTIPRGGFAPKTDPNVQAHPGYFLLEDQAQNLIVSGWFEPDQGFPGIREFWEAETGRWRERGLPTPRDVSFARIADWDAVLYDMALPSGSNSHIRAHWLQAGTWLDLHLSITSDRPPEENRKKLKTALKAMRVRQKE